MENQLEKKQTPKAFFEQPFIKKRFEDLLGKQSSSFLTSVLQIVASNNLLSTADPVSIFNSALMAATLDLPLNNNLGFAYIVPYNNRQTDGSFKQVAQFQLGYKGFIQLAQRSGQFKTISATPIYEGQLVESNPLTGFRFDFEIKSEKVIGFAAYFELLNGFQKTLYMPIDRMEMHGKKYSKTYGKNGSLWNTDFDGMGTKTVLKLLLSKYAPLSIEMQRAVIVDQALINDESGEDVTYIDNEVPEIDKEAERVRLLLNDCKTVMEVDALQIANPNIDVEFFKNRKKEIGGENVK